MMVNGDDRFTIEDFIKRHKLNVSPQDLKALRVIGQRLRELGYEKKKTRHGVFWVKKNKLEELKRKLKEIKE